MHQRSKSEEACQERKKIIFSYAKMSANLCVLGIDLNWADEQYWCTLLNIVREVADIRTPKKKEKVSASGMQNFIKD